jgi:hypothetical protein
VPGIVRRDRRIAAIPAVTMVTRIDVLTNPFMGMWYAGTRGVGLTLGG